MSEEPGTWFVQELSNLSLEAWLLLYVIVCVSRMILALISPFSRKRK